MQLAPTSPHVSRWMREGGPYDSEWTFHGRAALVTGADPRQVINVNLRGVWWRLWRLGPSLSFLEETTELDRTG
jgi:hypothetical protein